MEEFAPANTLALRPVLPRADALRPSAGIRPLVDGRDVLEEIHPGGDSSSYQERWFGPPETWPLWAADAPRRVELSNNDCDTGCCGGVFVTIRRRGDRVEWTGWENTSDTRVPVPPEFRFDAAQYDAELARVVADHSWEEPVDTAARLLAQRVSSSDWYERWDCRAYPYGIKVSEREEEPEVGMACMTYRSGEREADSWQTLPVSAREPVEDQVRHFFERIMATDPRERAEGV
ncbi:hypothetical protein [Streptomyces sp. NBC_01264]|uniref:hypothetical protein n=1 Tax=Streptomyces sp. NBC_01264 TaxID=2903804 RepID=UPI00225689D6|nr:hypothetical protein [Streptomyces sp. NBC_01264]MCX4776385.1 hypothetical protein [Streptomyces sp. NBC_01264]